MISFDKPLDFNGTQLCDELEAAGISINRETSPLIDGNGVFWLDINSSDTDKAQEVLNKHKSKVRPEPTILDKLASVGINLNELKVALGL